MAFWTRIVAIGWLLMACDGTATDHSVRPHFDASDLTGALHDTVTLSFSDFTPTTEDAAFCVFERSFATLGTSADPCHAVAGIPVFVGASVMRVSSYFWPSERYAFDTLLVVHDPSTGPYYEPMVPDASIDVDLGSGVVVRRADYALTKSSHVWTRIIASGQGDAFFGVVVSLH